MVKAYLRYEQSAAFGVISSNSNVAYDGDGKSIIAAALEAVAVWNVKTGSQSQLLAPSTASTSDAPASASPEVTQLARAPAGTQLAAGYSDGTVRLWDLATGECTVTLKGHKSAVTALRYSPSGALLASGGKDTDIIVWDVAAEAGLCRLRGHKDQVTDLVLLARGHRLVSCSKDGLLRVWDLDTQHCCQTLPAGKGEVWSLDINQEETRLVVGSTDTELRMFAVRAPAAGGAGEPSTLGPSRHEVLLPMGSVRRAGQDRTVMVRFGARGRLLGVLAAGKSLEVFSVRSVDEAAKKAKRRKKRRREKAAKKAKGADGKHPPADEASEEEEHEQEGEEAAGPGSSASDELAPLVVVAVKSKVKSFAWAPDGAAHRKGVLGQLALGLANNSIEVVDVRQDSYDTASRIELGGHRSDVRALALSADDGLLLSTSSSAAKLWQPHSGACLATMESGYGLCAVFAPGGRHAVIGTKEGHLEVFDIGACTRTHVEAAHGGPVWALALLPDKSGFVSGSADKTVKFWTWAVAPAGQGAEGGSKQLGIRHVRSLEMADDVLSLAVTPDGKLLAVALLDTTIKVFYTDSLKFFLSLYGHKLPVTSLAISSDGTLLASGSADKNIKVWGLDFGDCHKSLFAHGDAVMQLAWVYNTHYLFSVGKDKLLKYWDMDRHELLLELPGHHGEVWGLAVSAYGDFVVTASHDRSIRRWARTQEPFFVEEERERRLESLFAADLEERGAQGAIGSMADGATPADEQQNPTSAPAGRKTLESVSAADAIIDALDMAAHEEEQQEEYEREKRQRQAAAAASGAQPAPVKPPPVNPLMLGLSPSAFVLKAVAGVKANDLEQALLMLPFADAVRLLGYVAGWLEQGKQIELSSRTAALLLRLHHAQLVAAPSARPVLVALQKRLRPSLQALKDVLGFNTAGLKYLQRAAKEAAGVDDLDAATRLRAALRADASDGRAVL